MTALLLERLAVRDRAGRTLVAPLDLALERGGMVSLVGESGAGKSLVCAAVAGTLPPGLAAAGRIAIAGRSAAALPAAERRALWSRDLFLLPQEPWAALAPSRQTRARTADTPRLCGAGAGAGRMAGALLARLGLCPDTDGPKRPWQLSGGMAQRAAVAAALGAPAGLVLVDEPTKGLDAPMRDRVRDSLRVLLEDGRAVVLVTHDLQLAAAMGGEVLVMRDGAVVERGPADEVLQRPRHPFTRALAAAVPDRWPRRAVSGQPELLAVEGVTLAAGRGGRVLVSGLSLSVPRNGIVGLSGPSGSGKTTLGDTMLGLRPPAAGRVRWAGAERSSRPGARQKLYQDPLAAFAPWRRVGATMADAFAGAGRPRRTAIGVLKPMLARLGLSPSLLDRLPGEVSGGELQRLALARAMATQPAFQFADEPTSRLDPLTQQQVAGLLAELAEGGTACLLASHDPHLLAALAGQVVRMGESSAAEPAAPA